MTSSCDLFALPPAWPSTAAGAPAWHSTAVGARAWPSTATGTPADMAGRTRTAGRPRVWRHERDTQNCAQRTEHKCPAEFAFPTVRTSTSSPPHHASRPPARSPLRPAVHASARPPVGLPRGVRCALRRRRARPRVERRGRCTRCACSCASVAGRTAGPGWRPDGQAGGQAKSWTVRRAGARAGLGRTIPLVLGPFSWPGKWAQNLAQRCEARQLGLTSLSTILCPPSGPQKWTPGSAP